MIRIAALLAGLLLCGCNVGPDYRPPAPDAPPDWTEHPVGPAEAAATLAKLPDWWRQFQDPVLDQLVTQAIAGNLDLQIARQRILEARAEQVVAGADAYPQIGAAAAASIANSSTTLQYPPGTGEYRAYDAGFDASWELDVFGGIRRAEQAAAADAEAAEADRRAALVSLLAELAGDYAGLRATQARESIAARNIETAKALFDLTNTEYARGLTTSLAVAQARTQWDMAQAAIPPLRAEAARLVHAIAVLTGRPPGALETMLLQPAPVMPVPPGLPAALPADVVANRPDIARAERRLAAATARIGAAVAQLYPQVSIPLMLLPTTSYPSQFFSAASLVWSAGLSLSQNIYQGGRLSARVTEARAEAERDLLLYRQAVLHALQEVEDALAAYQQANLRQQNLEAAVHDSHEALDRAQRLYQAGLTDFLNLLTAERSVFAAEDAAALGRLAQLRQLIALYKALGGGWQGVHFAGDATAR